MALKQNYKDDILDTSQNVKRKYQMENNGDGTVSFTDVTEYTQQGDSFGASDMNATNGKVNTLDANLDGFKFYPTGTELVALVADDSFYTDENGKYVLADSPTGQTLLADTATYKSLASTEETHGEVGADTCSPFKTTHTDTYTYPSGSTGDTYDMGAGHKYRYVNATNVYNKGKADYTVTTVTTLKSDTTACYPSTLTYTFTSSYKLAIAIAIGGDYNGNQVASVTVNPSSKVALTGSLSCNNYAAGAFAVIKNPSSGDTVYMRDWVQGRRVVIGIN